jgi:hypothetical protein
MTFLTRLTEAFLSSHFFLFQLFLIILFSVFVYFFSLYFENTIITEFFSKFNTLMADFKAMLFSLIHDTRFELLKDIFELKNSVKELKLELTKQIQYQFVWEQAKTALFYCVVFIGMIFLGITFFKSFSGIAHNAELLKNASSNIIDCHQDVLNIKATASNIEDGVRNLQKSSNSISHGLAKTQTMVADSFSKNLITEVLDKSQNDPLTKLPIAKGTYEAGRTLCTPASDNAIGEQIIDKFTK